MAACVRLPMYAAAAICYLLRAMCIGPRGAAFVWWFAWHCPTTLKVQQGRLWFSFAPSVFFNMIPHVKNKSEGTFVL